ncbi:helix-turn-helix domain-containing protein (plasmid) [Methanosphaera sp. ISO3-F5]|uniref:winged helix-turn-helix transcriptional regulator n=1 Tax=Methanosphaera sp. ISO3-F5 TaxID=1452353 RepID=UPI002B263FAA|nr:helix-turn-helix domain-containing protein [Methanosphaera sp. ISO3-F5]WQH65374.1 helix-turn-helix domain-containing protein [Methanosphaera sp. ISO3-F5]
MEVKEVLRRNCPIKDTVEIINRKWAVILLWDMFNEYEHFNEFKEINPELNSNVLSDTLKFLIEHGLVNKISAEYKTRYALTEKGRSMNRIMYELGVYGIQSEDYDDHQEEIRKYFKKIFEI